MAYFHRDRHDLKDKDLKFFIVYKANNVHMYKRERTDGQREREGDKSDSKQTSSTIVYVPRSNIYNILGTERPHGHPKIENRPLLSK